MNCVLCVCSFAQLYLTCCDPWTVAHQAPLSMEFSRQEYWSRLPFPTPGDLPNPGIEPESLASPALAGGVFTAESSGKPSCALAMYNGSNSCSDAFSGIGRGGLSRHRSLPHSLNVFPGIRDSFSGALEANCEERLEC